MAREVIARMTLLLKGREIRALFVILLPGGRALSSSLLWASCFSSIRSDKGKCVKGGWVSEWRGGERNSFDIPIGSVI